MMVLELDKDCVCSDIWNISSWLTKTERRKWFVFPWPNL